MEINFSLNRPCSLITPTVIRYMNRVHIEDFFQNGKLMLTTYSKCRNHEEQNRLDQNEGKGNFEIEYPSINVSGSRLVGKNSYMLCMSMIESEDLSSKFNTDSYLIIDNAILFFDAVAKALAGFEAGKLGPCGYVDSRYLIKKCVDDLPDPKDMIEAAIQKDQEKLNKSFSEHQEALSKSIDSNIQEFPYFIKDSIFSTEAEFRMVWITSYEVNDSIIINCPEAIKYCRMRDAELMNRRSKGFNSDQSTFIIGGEKGPLK